MTATSTQPPSAKEWQPGSIAAGLIQLGIAAWLQFSFLPTHDANRVGALQVVGRGLQGQDTWVLKPTAYLVIQLITIALAANGILRLVVYSRRDPRRRK